MNWQDYVLSAGSLVFAVALIPSITSKNKPSIFTSSITVVVLLVFALVYLSLSLLFAAATVFVTSILWAVLAVQKYLQDKQ